MEEPFDYEEVTTQLQVRMSRYRLKNVWLISQLRSEGIQVTEGSFSRIIRNFTHSDYARNILETCVRILDDYERLFLEEMKKSREESLSPGGQGTYEILYNYCPEDGEGPDEQNLTETFRGTWDECQAYIKEMRQNGCYNISATQLDAGLETDAEVRGQNLPTDDLDIEAQQKKSGQENKIFEYGGYHFEPAGTYNGTEREGFWQASASDMYVVDAFMEDEPGAEPAYVKEFFYASAGVPADEVNLFRCIETGKTLVAGEASLFVYDGPVRKNGESISDRREDEECSFNEKNGPEQEKPDGEACIKRPETARQIAAGRFCPPQEELKTMDSKEFDDPAGNGSSLSEAEYAEQFWERIRQFAVDHDWFAHVNSVEDPSLEEACRNGAPIEEIADMIWHLSIDDPGEHLLERQEAYNAVKYIKTELDALDARLNQMPTKEKRYYNFTRQQALIVNAYFKTGHLHIEMMDAVSDGSAGYRTFRNLTSEFENRDLKPNEAYVYSGEEMEVIFRGIAKRVKPENSESRIDLFVVSYFKMEFDMEKLAAYDPVGVKRYLELHGEQAERKEKEGAPAETVSDAAGEKQTQMPARHRR